MFDTLSNVHYAQPTATCTMADRKKCSTPARGQGDSLSISEEAYAALEASRQSQAQRAASSGAASSSVEKVSFEEEEGAGGAAGVERTASDEKSLLGQLKAYIANPVLAHALEKMAKTVQGMGYDEGTAKVILEQVEAAFRSGIPAEGEQTTDAMNTLMKEIKKATGLEDEDLAPLSVKLTAIVEEAQRKDPMKGKESVADQGAENV